jgi:hypothetical protein
MITITDISRAKKGYFVHESLNHKVKDEKNTAIARATGRDLRDNKGLR